MALHPDRMRWTFTLPQDLEQSMAGPGLLLGCEGLEVSLSVSPELISRPDQKVTSTDKARPISFSWLVANG